MKQAIHPNYSKAKVYCNGCKTEFETRATVDSIEVEICSQCHPFYTGKQKLVDVAGRVDRFRAQQKAATDKKKAPARKKASTEDSSATDKDKKSLSDLRDLKK